MTERQTDATGDEEQPMGFDEAFELERRELMVRRLRLAMTMGLAVYLGFWALDVVRHPGHAQTFWTIRGTISALCLVVLLLTYRPVGQRLVQPMSFAILLLVGSSLSWMTVSLGGFESDYFIGNMLTLFFVGMFLPWPVLWSVAFCMALVLPYLGVNIWVHGLTPDIFSPTAFLTGTSVLTVFSTAEGNRARATDLRLRLALEQANDELKQLDEAKTRFFANVSHELRTPLMLISGPLEELATRVKDPLLVELLASITANVDRLTRHVNMILDFARIEGGRLRLKLETASIGDVLCDLVGAARPYATQHGITITASGLDTIKRSRFDREQVETIAANLLSNAVKFTPRGGQIHVRAWADDAEVHFEVRDDGPGIPAEEQERIFNRFYQVERGAAGKIKGTGLGLALCRELAKLHGGRLVVESAVGEGSAFRVSLPLAPVERERRQRGRRREDRMAQARLDSLIQDSYEQRQGVKTLLADVLPDGRLSGGVQAVAPDGAPRLLIVEDNTELLAYLTRNLGTDYQIETASDGVEGLDAARRHAPDLIISDLMMPRMTGDELVRVLQQEPALERVPVILLSARVGAEAVVEGLGSGAIDYVTKPFKMPELKARVETHLRTNAVEKQLDERETRLVAIGQMTGQIAHDLKGPLTAIVGHAELAREVAESTGSDAMIVQDLAAVEDAAHRAVSMIEQVVDFVREGSVPLRLERMPLTTFLDVTLEEQRSSLRPLGITLDLDVRATEPGVVVELDAGRMRRVVENLVTNAKEALVEQRRSGRRHGDRIVVSVSDDDEEWIQFRVMDNGPGFPIELAEELFQPFVTAGKEYGTGLGLAIVRNLVAAHGGSVTVEEPPPEGGAVFRVDLPRPTGP